MNLIILNGGHLYEVGNIHSVPVFAHTAVIIEVKPRMEVMLQKGKFMWRSSPGLRLVVSTVAPLGVIVVFSVKHTLRGASLLLLGECFGSTVRL